LSSWHGLPAGFSSFAAFAARLIPYLTTGLVATVVAGVAMSTRLDDVRREASEARFWRGLAVALVGVPGLAMVLAALFPLTPVGKALLILMGITPGAPLLLNRTRAAKGNVPLAVLLSVALSFAAAGLVPAGIEVANRLFSFALHGSVSGIVWTLLPSLWLPLAAGFAVRAAWPRAADRLAPVANRLSAVGLAVLGTLVFAASSRYLTTPSIWAWVAVVLLTLGGAAGGALVAGERPEDRRTLAYAVILGNPALTLLVARDSYPQLKLAPYVVIFAGVRIVVLLVLERASVSFRARRGAAGASAGMHRATPSRRSWAGRR
jgi:BASS family bile acid:Na+ symporter